MAENNSNGFRRAAKPLNIQAYYPKLMNYCRKWLMPVQESRAFGKTNGLAYVLPNKNWAVLYDPTDEGHKKDKNEMILTRWKEVDPVTKDQIATGKTIIDLVAMRLGVENKKENFGPHIRPELIKEYGRYTGEQKNIHSEKYDAVKAKEQETIKRRQTAERAQNALINMETSLITQIEKDGTLFGQEMKSFPILVSRQMMKVKNGIPTEGQVSLNGLVREGMSGLRYIQCMQDDYSDKRYILNEDFKQMGRPLKFGDGKSVTQALGYGVFKKENDQGKPTGRQIALLFQDHANQNLPGAGTYSVSSEAAMNVQDVEFRERGAGVIQKSNVPKQKIMQPKMEIIADRAVRDYGKWIHDKEAFMKDPAGTMREVVSACTENDKINLAGMKILQRELIVQYALHGLGYKEPIQIPEEDRNALVEFLAKDAQGYTLKNGAQRKPGHFLINSASAMDINQKMMLGKGVDNSFENGKEVVNHKRFSDLSIEFLSDYTTCAGMKIPAGAGSIGHKKIREGDAYALLADIVKQDRRLFGNPENENYGKTVSFSVTQNGKKYEALTLHLGALEMGNHSTIAESLTHLMTQRERNDAYNARAINDNYRKWLELKEYDQPGFSRTSGANKEEFVEKERQKLFDKENTLQDELKPVLLDETVKKVNTGQEFYDESLAQSKLQANVFRYLAPTENVELIHENFSPKDLVRVVTSRAKEGERSGVVIELRKPMQPVIEMQKVGDEEYAAVVCNENGEILYADPVLSRKNGTEALQCTPYLTQFEEEQQKILDRKLAITFECDGQSQTLYGSEGRNMFIHFMSEDRRTFEAYNEQGYVPENDMVLTTRVTYDKQLLLESSCKMGDMKMGNYPSFEAFMKEMVPKSLKDAYREGYEEMLAICAIEKKYGKNWQDEKYLAESEILKQSEKENQVLMNAYEQAAIRAGCKTRDEITYHVVEQMKEAGLNKKEAETLFRVARPEMKNPIKQFKDWVKDKIEKGEMSEAERINNEKVQVETKTNTKNKTTGKKKKGNERQ